MSDQITKFQIKQFVANKCSEYDITEILSNFHKTQDLFIVNNETAVGPSDQDNTIVEYDYGWRIVQKLNDEIVGRIQLEEFPIGVLISCRLEVNGTWEIVDKFLNQLFTKMEANGFTTHPFLGREIAIKPKAFTTQYKKVPLQSSGKVLNKKSTGKINEPCEGIVPKKQETREKWKKAYKIILSMDNKYFKAYQNGDTDNPSPKYGDYQDGLATAMKWKPSIKTIQNIIKVAEAGYLNI